MSCIFCKESDGDLKLLTRTGLGGICRASVARGDDLHLSLPLDGLSGYRIHNNCRTKYVDKRNFGKSLNLISSDKESCSVESCGVADCCVFCGKSTRWARKALISQIKDVTTVEHWLGLCGNDASQHTAEVISRLSSGNILKYHRKCSAAFLYSKKNTSQNVSESVNTSLHSADDSLFSTCVESVATDGDNLALLTVADCGAATSHAQFLANVAAVNNGQLVSTVGHGDCLFDAIRISLSQHGVQRTINELRQLAGIELQLNAALYRPLYCIEDHGLHQQAPTYELFVTRTTRGTEWGTELTICAMARGLNMPIRVFSSGTDNHGNPFCTSKSYADGVTNMVHQLTVFYNAAEGHYLGFSPSVIQGVDRRLSAMSIEDDGLRTGVSVSHQHDNVDLNETCVDDVSRMSVSSGNVFYAVESDRDDVFDANVEFADVHDTGPRPMSVSCDADTATDASYLNGINFHQYCANCERVSLADMKINFTSYNGDIIRRRFCRLDGISAGASYILCTDCIKYLTIRLPQGQLWASAWPSVITCLLTKDEYSCHRVEVWKMLPTVHRQSWHTVAVRVGLRFDDEPLFDDFTRRRTAFNGLVTSGSIADFLAAMSSFAFPCVKCPLGCFAYVDECNCMPFNHFIDWKFELSFFDSKRQHLTAARCDWPCRSVQLETFNVLPGIVVDQERGLCVLLCASHGQTLNNVFVHVPRNPVLKDLGFQYPDNCAAAILTPNVIREGRMHQWNSSTHVVKAIGGYTGISSSTITPRLDMRILDERLSTAECLAMRHRSDIYHICHDRFVDSFPDGDKEFERVLNHYDLYYKPMVDAQKYSSLKGATFVDVSDCFQINEMMFRRDARNGGDERALTQLESWKLCLNFVHSAAGPSGCSPVDMTPFYSLDKHPVAGAIVHLLVHSPCLRDVLLVAFEQKKSDFLHRLLLFSQHCAGQSRNTSKIRNASELEKQIDDELPLSSRVASLNDVCLKVVSLLASFSSSIFSVSFTADHNLQHIMFPANADVALIYRSTTSSIRSDRSKLPIALNGLHLVAVLGGNHLTDTVHFRWNERFRFWLVKRNKRCQRAKAVLGDDISVPDWRILVYARGRLLSYIDEKMAMNLSGQRRMWCDLHRLFLVKQPLHSQLLCCVKDCRRTARWSCLGRGETCPHSVCFCHGQDIVTSDAVVTVDVDMPGRTLRPCRSAQEERDARESDDEGPNIHGMSESESDDDDMDPRVLAPMGIDDFQVDVDAPPLHTRQDLIPVFDMNRDVPSHLIWNNQYNVMRRGNRYPDVRSNAMIEHIVASTNSISVSLLYPEGQLFPRIFWCSKSGSVIGALPSFMMNTTVKCPLGLASLSQHQYVRIRDGDILTSRESGYWHYLFDVKLNTALNKVPSKLVFKRGLEFLETDKNRHCGESSVDGQLPMDEAEATRRIKELASLLKKGKWTYFLTLTVNDSETPGVRQITEAIRRVAAGNEALERELTDNFLTFVLRAWERFVRFFLQNLVMRNDEIIGRVQNIFYRFEFQGAGAKGNKPHVHCGITLFEEPESVSVSRICCNSLNFHTSLFKTNFESLLTAGIVTDLADYQRWEKTVSCVNFHDCSATQYRCMKATNAAGDKICRYRRQPRLPLGVDAHGWFDEIPMPYTDDVYLLLEEMGLAHRDFDSALGSERWYVGDELKAGKWHYYALQDEFFLATIPLVSAICRSSTNVDMCDRKFQVSYLVKYISGKEEHQLVDVAPSKDINEVRVNTEGHQHEKITGCKKIMSRNVKSKTNLGREICLAEVVWFLLEFPYTYCNAEFVHVPTLPLENRVGVLQKSMQLSKHLCGHSTEDINAVRGRVSANLPDWRRFSPDQLAHIEDYRHSPYWCDAASSFNVRPPELLVFDDLQLYCECFVVVSTQECSFVSDVGCQPWFDGLSRRILLRSCSIAKAVAFVSSKAEDRDPRALELLAGVFGPIVMKQSGFFERFVQMTDAHQVVSVVSLVKPWDRTKFLSHLCLSLGRYRSEVDLFFNGTLKSAFFKAGLFPNSSDVTRADVLSVLRRYVVEDLRFHPISARQFDKYVKAAMHALNDLVHDNVVGDYSPCVSDVMLKEQAVDVLSNMEETRRSNLVSALQEDPAISSSLPNNLLTASLLQPIMWIPQIVPVSNISLETVAEQSAALDCCIRAIDNFLNPACHCLKFPCLVGRAGSGKSHVLKLATAYALSKGLQVELMSITSERARKLGGNHMHLVFPFGVSNSRITFSHNLAASCLAQLAKDPLKMALLKRTDVIIFEELGQLSAEYYSAIDNVLRILMGNSKPMGGKLFISCGDSKQLPPINGRPIWGSLNMCTLMEVFVFSCDVRARDDLQLQRLNSDCRRELSVEECSTVASTVLNECRFEDNWSTVPDVAVRIVPTKAAEMKVVAEFLKDRQTKSYRAIDEVQNGAVWERASDRVTIQLNKNCYEYDVCKLYINAVVRMTFNRRQDGISIFSQGQVAVIVRLPEDSGDFHEQRLTLRLAPPGNRQISPNDIGNDWPEVVVGPRTTLPTVVGRGLQMGRRTQFPVRYHLASTIHRIQGDTVPLLATEMSLSKREYRLWQREQFAVLISRVHRCQDIIFVGSRVETRAAIEHIMRRSSKWDSLIQHYLSELNVAVQPARARRLLLDTHPFLPMYRELPSAACGYAYMLVSLSSVARTFIGETTDLKRCLRKHNTGYGEEETRNTSLHPWGIYAFAYGFEESSDDRVLRTVFAEQWRGAVSPQTTPDDAFRLGTEIADEWLSLHACRLTVVKCGQYSPQMVACRSDEATVRRQ